jgi:hypothetical protein
MLNKHRSYQLMVKNKRTHLKKINYGVYKSKFISSSKIEFDKNHISFPKIKNISSFLPWIYSDKSFNDGIHEFKINSEKYPIIQNSGFTVLE